MYTANSTRSKYILLLSVWHTKIFFLKKIFFSLSRLLLGLGSTMTIDGHVWVQFLCDYSNNTTQFLMWNRWWVKDDFSGCVLFAQLRDELVLNDAMSHNDDRQISFSFDLCSSMRQHQFWFNSPKFWQVNMISNIEWKWIFFHRFNLCFQHWVSLWPQRIEIDWDSLPHF